MDMRRLARLGIMVLALAATVGCGGGLGRHLATTPLPLRFAVTVEPAAAAERSCGILSVEDGPRLRVTSATRVTPP